MAYILNIETATPVCSVSLAKDGKTIDCIENNKDQTHAELLTVYIEKIFLQNNITSKDLLAVAVSAGPGSYTGLRIGVSVAKGICYGCNIPLISIPTLEAMAWGSNQEQADENVLLCPMIDARRMEVYSSIFDTKLNVIENTKAMIVEGDAYKMFYSDNKMLFFGTGSDKCQSVITHPNAIFLKDLFISSQNMSELSFNKFQKSIFEDVAYYEPFYLKKYLVTTSTKNPLS